jgi:hypothetical protein
LGVHNWVAVWLTAQGAKESGFKWFPYMKGGTFRRWYGNQDFVVNWRNGAEEISAFDRAVIRNPDFYFRRGVTWTDLTAGRFSARLSPGGFVFDVSGSSVFPPDVELVLAVMNSSWAQYALKLINPTVHVQVGDLARLPVPKQSSATLRGVVDRAVARAKADSEEDETTYDFIAPPLWPGGTKTVTQRHDGLAELERQIDDEVYRLYEISDEDRQAIEADWPSPSQMPKSTGTARVEMIRSKSNPLRKVRHAERTCGAVGWLCPWCRTGSVPSRRSGRTRLREFRTGGGGQTT